MNRPRLYVLSAGVRRTVRGVSAALSDFELHFKFHWAKHQPGDGVLAWGMRPSALRARGYAQKHGLHLWHVEDGFLRSVGLGKDDPPLSIVLDDLGLYLDASQPSRLESLIGQPLDDAQSRRALALACAWREGRVSKYNHARDVQLDLPDDCVLVVDQTFGDASIACGAASPAAFARMLDAALVENPDRLILLKVHPDVVSGHKRGHFDLAQIRALPRVRVLDDDLHPASLFERVHKVYTVTSQMGFEALLWNLPVRVFGMPFYAGWGLTQDELPAPQRRGPVGLAQLIHAALIAYPRYIDPETGGRCEAETLLAWLALQRRMMQRFAPKVVALGFSPWKRRWVRAFFRGSQVDFRSKGISRGQSVAVWGRGNGYDAATRGGACPVITLEDGFLRSVGLGAHLIRPLSWVQDDLGIYYDASGPSRLEHILVNTVFSHELLGRAAALRQAILEAGITKYNLQGAPWQRPPQRHVILVPGQVESDASIRRGATSIRNNMALLQAVRQAHPGSHIVYKPHPDVVAGLRDKGQGENSAGQWCDEIVTDTPMGQLLQNVDAVHVLTSLTGFEALLRGLPVTTYGQPFYAGWGLAQDLALTDAVRQRRGRQLSLNQLVAGVLILYPAYVSRASDRYTTPERTLRELQAWRGQADVSLWRRVLLKLFRKT
jgi:capsular polysaccharide export protein